jgi:hypothetical protein
VVSFSVSATPSLLSTRLRSLTHPSTAASKPSLCVPTQCADVLCNYCSAGVGRSGTFIALDHCLHELVLTRFTDPLHVIRTVRQDRSALVQHTLQYSFLHECVVAFGKSKCAELVVETTATGSHFFDKSRFSEVDSDDDYVQMAPAARRSRSYIEAVRMCRRGQIRKVPKKRPFPEKGGCCAIA